MFWHAKPSVEVSWSALVHTAQDLIPLLPYQTNQLEISMWQVLKHHMVHVAL